MENELAALVDKEGGLKQAQKAKLEQVQERLGKTMELKSRVENLFVDELKGIIEKLDAESAAEVLRGEDISALMAKFESVLAQKREAVVRDEELLEDMQSTLGMVREASIQRTMQSAIDDKEALCTIERELIGKMELCLGQLATELAESGGRGAKMAEVRSNLPAVDDPTAVRGYSWADIEALNSVLSESAASARDREAAVESIKADFAAAMDRRRRVLQGDVPPLNAPPTAPLRSAGAVVLPSAAASPAVLSPAAGKLGSRAAARQPNDDELALELGAAAAGLGGAVAKITTDIFGTLAGVLGSSGTKRALSSASKAAGGVVGAAKAASLAWDREVEETVSANIAGGAGAGEWWVKEAFSKVLASEDVKASLAESSAASKEALEGLSEAASSARKSPSDGPSTSSLDDLRRSTVRLAKVVSALVGRTVGGDSGAYQLPPPSNKR